MQHVFKCCVTCAFVEKGVEFWQFQILKSRYCGTGSTCSMSVPVGTSDGLLWSDGAMASNPIAMASNLEAMAPNPIAMTSNLEAMAFTLWACLSFKDH